METDRRREKLEMAVKTGEIKPYFSSYAQCVLNTADGPD